MTRLFFDVVGRDGPMYDHVGRYFDVVEHAVTDAEYLSLDLSCTENQDWLSTEVQVRNVSGQHLFSVPVMPLA